MEDLRAIDGVGQARCERYGEAFLDLLLSLQTGSGDSQIGQVGPKTKDTQ